MATQGYKHIPRLYPSIDGELEFTAAQTTVTLKTAKSTAHTIHVQRIIVWIKTDAAQSITFEDNNGTPVVVAKIPASPGVDTRWDFDFGPKGKALTAGKNLVATFSAAGLAGHLHYYGYQTPQ